MSSPHESMASRSGSRRLMMHDGHISVHAPDGLRCALKRQKAECAQGSSGKSCLEVWRKEEWRVMNHAKKVSSTCKP